MKRLPTNTAELSAPMKMDVAQSLGLRKPLQIDAGLIGFLAGVVVVIVVVHQAGDLHYDFAVFYYAARMVWERQGHSLYNVAVQHIFQARYQRPQEFIFCSPGFALLPFLPFATMPMRIAFVCWTVLSVVLLTLCVRSLCLQTGILLGNWPLLFAVAFMPVALTLSHGQLSIIVLAAYAACYLLWRRGCRFTGGMVLAVATVKFQLLAGFVSVLICRKKWREVVGFAAGCAPCILVSVLMTGWRGLMQYPTLLAVEERTAGVDPKHMASLRGLVATFTGHRDTVVVVAFLSVGAVILAAAAWRDLETGFSAGLLASMLTSYHFNPQDLSLLLIPLFLISAHLRLSRVMILAGLSYLLPLVFWFSGYFSLFAILLLTMLVAIYKYGLNLRARAASL